MTPTLQLAVRFALFHLMATVGERGRGGGRRARAERRRLPRPRVLGRDVYVLPFLAATRPAAARAMLEYRVRRLPAALRGGPRTASRGRALSVGVGGRRRGRHATAGARPRGRVVADPHRRRSRSTSSPTSPGRRPATSTGPATRRSRAGRGASCSSRPRAGGRRGSSSTRVGAGTSGTSSVPTSTTSHVDDNAYTNVMARWNLRRAASRQRWGR